MAETRPTNWKHVSVVMGVIGTSVALGGTLLPKLLNVETVEAAESAHADLRESFEKADAEGRGIATKDNEKILGAIKEYHQDVKNRMDRQDARIEKIEGRVYQIWQEVKPR